MSLLVGRHCSRLFPCDAFTAVTTVSHCPHSALALWQAVNGYQRLQHVSTLHSITNSPLSLSFVSLPVLQLAHRCSVPCLNTRWKRVRRWVECLTLMFPLPQQRVKCLNSKLSLCCVRKCVHTCSFMSCWLQLYHLVSFYSWKFNFSALSDF